MERSATGAGDGAVTWEAPGAGRWRLDADHAERPVRRAGWDIYEGMEQATIAAYGSLGLATQCMRIVFVNGWPYVQVEMVDDAVELARRESHARAAVVDGSWRDVVNEWFDVGRREFIDRCLTVQGALDGPEANLSSIAEVVAAAGALAIDGPAKHFTLTPGYLGAGLFLEGHEPGEPRERALSTLGGASPGTREPAELAGAVADALANAAQRVESVADIRKHSPAAAVALHRFLERFGSRSLDGFPDAPILLERPDLVIRSIRSAHRHRSSLPTRTEEVPLDVQRSYGLRDDNVGITCNWTAGLLHRAINDAGLALHEEGLLDDPAHAFHVSVADIVEACEQRTAGLGSIAAESAKAHEVAASSPPPPVLDGERIRRSKPELPTYVARATSALMTYSEPVPRQASDAGTRGIGVGNARVQGRAVVADDAIEASQRLDPDDILVTKVTDSAFNVLLTQVAGLVTEHGGGMSHAALMARELGIPAIIGVPAAMSQVPDGALIELDPVEGFLRIIDADPPRGAAKER
ncbi:MAG: PEP-utilizing enzyme [Acidimicrobiia bacterium]|nr:PEP-utilizing enzyme [Acidimicrobiia bacterium]